VVSMVTKVVDLEKTWRIDLQRREIGGVGCRGRGAIIGNGGIRLCEGSAQNGDLEKPAFRGDRWRHDVPADRDNDCVEGKGILLS